MLEKEITKIQDLLINRMALKHSLEQELLICENQCNDFQHRLHALQRRQITELAEILPALRFTKTNLGLNPQQLKMLKSSLLEKKKQQTKETTL